MKKIFLLLIIVSTFLSCNSKSESEVELFNGLSFKLIDGEQIKNIDSETKENYQSFINNPSVQIPLFKCVESKDYKIYLGLPINSTIKKLVDFKMENIKNPSFFESDTITYMYVNHENEMKYIAEYFKIIDNNTIYILTVSNSQELSDSLFSLDGLSSRLKSK